MAEETARVKDVQVGTDLLAAVTLGAVLAKYFPDSIRHQVGTLHKVLPARRRQQSQEREGSAGEAENVSGAKGHGGLRNTTAAGG